MSFFARIAHLLQEASAWPPSLPIGTGGLRSSPGHSALLHQVSSALHIILSQPSVIDQSIINFSLITETVAYNKRI